MFEFGEGADDPVDALVGFDAADGQHAELLRDGTDVSGFGRRAKAAHAGDLCFDVEVLATFAAEVFAGDDGVPATAQTVSDDAVGDGDAEFRFGAAEMLVAEEGRCVVHEDMEAAHACECGVECRLVAGEEGFWCGVLTEVAA